MNKFRTIERAIDYAIDEVRFAISEEKCNGNFTNSETIQTLENIKKMLNDAANLLY